MNNQAFTCDNDVESREDHQPGHETRFVSQCCGADPLDGVDNQLGGVCEACRMSVQFEEITECRK